jgi:hypothetical protein
VDKDKIGSTRSFELASSLKKKSLTIKMEVIVHDWTIPLLN